MILPPVEVLLSWPTPNYENPTTRGDALLIVNSIFLSLAVITVSLRMYTRLMIKRWLGIDDVFILLGLVFTIGLAAVVLLANQHYGWDRHIYDIELYKIEPTSKIAMAAKVVFTVAATFTRLSLHCLYYRLVQDSGIIWFTWIVHANVIYTLGIFISFPLIAIFLCTPVSNYWKLGAPAESCLDEGVVTLVCGIINTIADFATTVTPIPVIMGLHMPLRQRMGVVVLFALGMIVTVAGIVRTWYIYKSLMAEHDNTWYAYPLWIAAAVEIDLGVICASAPVLRPLLAKIPFSLSGTFSRGISFNHRTPISNSDSSSKKPTPVYLSKPFSKTTTAYSRHNSQHSLTLTSNRTTLDTLIASTNAWKHQSAPLPITLKLSPEPDQSDKPSPWNPWNDVERGIIVSGSSQYVKAELEPEPETETEAEAELEYEPSTPDRLPHQHRSNSQDVILESESSDETRRAARGLKRLWPWGRVRSDARQRISMTITRTEEFELRDQDVGRRGMRHDIGRTV